MRAVLFVAAAAISTCWPGATWARPVFFDDFEGNALLPHWNQPPAPFWQYNVSNSMLNVTGLFFPSNPKFPFNSAIMGALFAPQADFRMDVWMGWESATAEPYELDLSVSGGIGTGIIATFQYSNWPGNPPQISASATSGVSASPPLPGIHQFTIARVGDQFEFYIDGALFANLPDTTGLAATGLSFQFVGPYPGQLPPFHVDRVEVVPGPGFLAIAGVASFAFARRSRRRS